MNSQQEVRPMKDMIQGIIELNHNILNIPGLSSGQRNELVILENELVYLAQQKDEAKIKNQLLDVFNRL
jgi:hypothetical protein